MDRKAGNPLRKLKKINDRLKQFLHISNKLIIIILEKDYSISSHCWYFEEFQTNTKIKYKIITRNLKQYRTTKKKWF